DRAALDQVHAQQLAAHGRPGLRRVPRARGARLHRPRGEGGSGLATREAAAELPAGTEGLLMRTVIITGASGNLGRAVAGAFSRDKLVLMDVKTGVNLLDPESIRAALKGVERVDVLCNIAGGFRMGTPVHETSDKDWNFLMDLNARTVVNMARVVVPLMLKAGAGKIVNVGAFAAQK